MSSSSTESSTQLMFCSWPRIVGNHKQSLQRWRRAPRNQTLLCSSLSRLDVSRSVCVDSLNCGRCQQILWQTYLFHQALQLSVSGQQVEVDGTGLPPNSSVQAASSSRSSHRTSMFCCNVSYVCILIHGLQTCSVYEHLCLLQSQLLQVQPC